MTNVVKKALATAVLVGAAGAAQAQTPGCGVGANGACNGAPVANASALVAPGAIVNNNNGGGNGGKDLSAVIGGGVPSGVGLPSPVCAVTKSAASVHGVNLAVYTYNNTKISSYAVPVGENHVKTDKNPDGVMSAAELKACQDMASAAAAKNVCETARQTWLAAQGDESKAVSYAAAIAACPDLKKAHDSVKGAFSTCAAKGAGYKLNMLGECVAPVVPTPPTLPVGSAVPTEPTATMGRVEALPAVRKPKLGMRSPG